MKIEIFECTSGVGKTSGKPFNIVVARVNGKVGKFFSQTAFPVGEADVDMDISTNRDMFFGLSFKPAVGPVSKPA